MVWFREAQASPFSWVFEMTHSVKFQTRDGQTLAVDCGPEQTLLQAAESAGYGLQAQCRQGSCGACHAQVRLGDFHLGQHSAEALRPEPGAVLLCCTHADSDLNIDLPYDAGRIVSSNIPERSASITLLEAAAERTLRLELQLDADPELGSAAQFEPGQFMELISPTGIRRAYSLANTGNWDGRLEFFIRLHADGQFSEFLSMAQPGDKLRVKGPMGAFGLDNASLRPRWFVGGGTGLAPLLSMLRQMAEFGESQPAKLFYGANRHAELFALAELQTLQNDLPQLETQISLIEGDAEWTGLSGTPVHALSKALLTVGELPDIYVCGPPAMIDAVEAVARNAGLPPEQLHCERFLPG